MVPITEGVYDVLCVSLPVVAIGVRDEVIVKVLPRVGGSCHPVERVAAETREMSVVMSVLRPPAAAVVRCSDNLHANVWCA